VFGPQGVWVAQVSQGRKIVAEKAVGLKRGIGRRVAQFYLPSWSNGLERRASYLSTGKGFPLAMGVAAISIRLRPVRLAA
jgi:hypothetical protein